MPISFNLGYFSIIRLAALILSLSISVYLLSIRGKSASTTILACAFIGTTLFNLSMLFEHSYPYYWRSHNVQNVISPFLLTIGISTAVISFLLFSYYFPHYRENEKRELLLVLLFAVTVNAVILGLTVYNFIILEMFRSNYEFDVVFYRILTIAGGAQFLLVVFLLIRKTIVLEKGEPRSNWLKFFKPQRRDARATRALAVVLLLPLATAFFYLLRYFYILPVIISIHFVWYVLLLFYFSSIYFYLNNSEERTSFQVKLVGGTLVVMFAIMGTVAIVVGKVYERDYNNLNLISDHTTIRFAPNENGSYDISKIQYEYDADLGTSTKIKYGSRKTVNLDFSFPYFKKEFQKLHILSGPMIFLGEDVRELGWGGYHPQPTIAPIIMNLNPSRGGDIFVKSEGERATITWYKVPEYFGSSPNTIQLVLYKSGTFDVSYAELNLDRGNRSIKIETWTTANTSLPIEGNKENKRMSFEPKLIGIHPGGKDAPLQPVRFMRDLPYHSVSPGVIFEAYDVDYDHYLHTRMLPLAIVLVGVSVFIFFLYPVLFKSSLIIPLRVLLEGIKKVDKGDFNVTISPLFNDEIGFLTRSFNRMLISIKNAETNFQTLAEDAEDGIFIILEGEKTVFANKSASRITGFDHSDLTTIGFDELVQPDEFDMLRGRRLSEDDVLQNSKRFETTFKNKSGGKVPVELTVSSIIWHGKRAQVVMVRDIIERKKIEERTMQQQEHLLKMDKLTSLGILAAGLAHEINNPNQTILSSASLLGKASPEILSVLRRFSSEAEGFLIAGLDYADFQRKYPELISRIEWNASRIDGIVKNLKAFSRDEPSHLFMKLNINDVIRNAITLAENYIRKATDAFSLDLEENIPEIKGNAQWLEQVIINLILNACQSLTSREQVVSVCSSRDNRNNAALIIVRDEGVGIPKENLEKVKEAFFSTKFDQGGMGLGLYVSEAIVKRHEGAITFDSQQGRGTTAVVSLPLSEGE